MLNTSIDEFETLASRRRMIMTCTVLNKHLPMPTLLVRTSIVVLLINVCLSKFVHSDAPAKPNVILIVADDLGWGDVGYHESRIETPHLDALAQRGVRLEEFYVQPVCSPTRGALMTGRYPIRLGLQCGVVRPWAEHGLPLDEKTLPDSLRDAGYRTAIVGKWHLGHVSRDYLPTSRGFDLQYGHYNGALDYFTHLRDGGHDWHRNDQPNYDEGYSTDLIGRAASRIIEEHNAAEPLFLYVPFNAPHTPLQAPEKWMEKYSNFKQKNRQTYAAMVSCMDDAIGRIIAAADRHLPQENTLIFFCSDNGGIPRLGSNGQLRAGKGTLYEGGVRVPAMAAWRDTLRPGEVVREPLHVVDLYPTLLTLAGVEARDSSKPLDGRNAWPTIANGQPSPHETILMNVTPFQGAIRSGNWKLVHNGHVAANATAPSPENKWELFDLSTDPTESTDVHRQRPRIFDRLKAELSKFAETASKPNIPPNRPPVGFKSPKVWGHGAP